jgi:antitoxin component of MazEF toxin-antitoxin module
MAKAVLKEGFIIELPREVIKKVPLKEGDWLKVKLLNGKEIVLEKPKKDYWDETFAWGKEFAKERKIKSQDVIKAVRGIRSGK